MYLIQRTIGVLASIADKVREKSLDQTKGKRRVVRVLFTKIMQRLLEVTQEAGEAGKDKKSHSMQIDDSSSKSSLSER